MAEVYHSEPELGPRSPAERRGWINRTFPLARATLLASGLLGPLAIMPGKPPRTTRSSTFRRGTPTSPPACSS